MELFTKSFALQRLAITAFSSYPESYPGQSNAARFHAVLHLPGLFLDTCFSRSPNSASFVTDVDVPDRPALVEHHCFVLGFGA
jgi:hypothetical protein